MSVSLFDKFVINNAVKLLNEFSGDLWKAGQHTRSTDVGDICLRLVALLQQVDQLHAAGRLCEAVWNRAYQENREEYDELFEAWVVLAHPEAREIT